MDNWDKLQFEVIHIVFQVETNKCSKQKCEEGNFFITPYYYFFKQMFIFVFFILSFIKFSLLFFIYVLTCKFLI